VTTVTIQLSPETERLLRLRASQRGESLEAYLRRLAEQEATADAETPAMLSRGLEWLTPRVTNDVRAARERLLGASAPPRKLPAGQTMLEAVEGKWPGMETDTEVRQALDRIS
jgi:hypothetical protein